MNRIIIALTTAFTLSGCDQLPGLLTALPIALPTPAEICALSDANRAALAKALGADAEELDLACIIAG